MIFDDDRLIQMLKDAPNVPTIKIFYFIAHNQPIDGIKGFETTKEQLAYDLSLKLPTVFRSLRWLKGEMLIQETKQVDTVDLMANPRFVMNNSDFQTRTEEWRRRQRLDMAREDRLRKQKRLRALKNANKQ